MAVEMPTYDKNYAKTMVTLFVLTAPLTQRISQIAIKVNYRLAPSDQPRDLMLYRVRAS